jgi:prepilin-type N-terminal cleavage/methylation domain-containing protein
MLIFKQSSSQAVKQSSSQAVKLKLGFTLSELLVSLAVLGLIAGLTVPSVVQSVERGKNRSVMKEDFQVLSAIIQAGVLTGDFDALTSWDIVNENGSTSLAGYFNSKLNSVRQCLTGDFTSQGCLKNPATNGGDDNDSNNHNARWVLPNGSKVRIHRISQLVPNQLIPLVILSKADQTMNVITGNNVNTVYTRCNVGSSSVVVNGITLKPGTCGGHDLDLDVELNRMLGNT